jgi:hypothetical protein
MTDRVDQLISSKEGFDPDAIAALDDSDRSDALNRALDAGDPDRLRALEILALSDPGGLDQAANALLGDASVDPAVLAAALTVLASAGATATPLARASVSSSDPTVALAAWRTLQQTATGADLSDLQSAAPAAGEVVGNQAAFALSVIAYRAQVAGFELPAPDSSVLMEIGSGAGTMAIDASMPTDGDFGLLMRRSASDLYQLSLSQQASVALDSADEHLLVCLDTNVLQGLPDNLTQVPTLGGLAALLDPLGTGYSVQFLILSSPVEGGFNLSIHRPDGALTYFGSGSVGDGVASGSLATVSQPGAVPVAIAFQASSSGVQFTQAVAATDVDPSTPKMIPDEEAVA